MGPLDLAAHREGVDVGRVDDDQALGHVACQDAERVGAARRLVGRHGQVPVDDGHDRCRRTASESADGAAGTPKGHSGWKPLPAKWPRSCSSFSTSSSSRSTSALAFIGARPSRSPGRGGDAAGCRAPRRARPAERKVSRRQVESDRVGGDQRLQLGVAGANPHAGEGTPAPTASRIPPPPGPGPARQQPPAPRSARSRGRGPAGRAASVPASRTITGWPSSSSATPRRQAQEPPRSPSRATGGRT